jgi:hypothetical protein
MTKVRTIHVETNRLGVRAWLEGAGDLEELTTVIDNALKLTGDDAELVVVLTIKPTEEFEEDEEL